MNFVMYLLLVILYPLTYLVIGYMAGNAQNNFAEYFISYFVSMAMSMFLNMQSTVIATSNQITTIELYKTYNTNPFYVFLGLSLFHIFLLSFVIAPLFVTGLFLVGFSTWQFLLTLLISLLFLALLSMFIGGLIKNPNIASPISNMIYMIAIIITPLYAQYSDLLAEKHTFASLNPFMHMLSMYRSAFGLDHLFTFVHSCVLLTFLTLVLVIYATKRWLTATASERISIFHS